MADKQFQYYQILHAHDYQQKTMMVNVDGVVNHLHQTHQKQLQQTDQQITGVVGIDGLEQFGIFYNLNLGTAIVQPLSSAKGNSIIYLFSKEIEAKLTAMLQAALHIYAKYCFLKNIYHSKDDFPILTDLKQIIADAKLTFDADAKNINIETKKVETVVNQICTYIVKTNIDNQTMITNIYNLKSLNSMQEVWDNFQNTFFPQQQLKP